MMNILFDLSSTQPVSGSDFHGGGEYAKTVFRRLLALLPSGTSLEVFYNPVKNIDKTIIEMCLAKNIVINKCNENRELSALLLKKKYTVFYSALPYSYADIVIPDETRFIYTVHGLRQLEYPADIYEPKYHHNSIKDIIKYVLFRLFPSWWKNRLSKKSIKNFNALFSRAKNQTIITVSNHSKFAMAYFFPNLDITQIKVLYSFQIQSIPSVIDDAIVLKSFTLKPGRYILLIGGDRSEKGAYRACRVLYKMILNNSRFPDDIAIVVLGVSQPEAYRKLTQNNTRFILKNYVDRTELDVLFRNAHLFMYPTMNEGFGYPPLEAMQYGTLCACSANSAVTEVCGDSVLYFNPFDTIEISIRILQSFDPAIRAEKSVKMTKRLAIIKKKQEQDFENLIGEIIR